jgi:DNA damage-binding protein 1
MSNETARFSGNQNKSVQYKGVDINEIEEGNKETGKALINDLGKAVVFGGLDGLFTTFAILSASSGGKVSWNIVLVIGLSCILANALTMGVAEYLSSKAHREYVQLERRRGLWEFRHYKDAEIKQVFIINTHIYKYIIIIIITKTNFNNR